MKWKTTKIQEKYERNGTINEVASSGENFLLPTHDKNIKDKSRWVR